MVRDFTESTLRELKDAALVFINEYFGYSCGTTYEEMLDQTYNVAGGNCVVDVDSIQSGLKSLILRNEMGYTGVDEGVNKIENIFKEARDRDAESLSSVNTRLSNASTPYLESMQQLADCIDVGALGKDYASFNFNRGYYHSTFDESVYGEPTSFKMRVDAVEGGASERCYESIKDYMKDEEDLETLKEKLHRKPEDIEPWEEDALIALLNDCIEYDVNGKPVVNYEKISVILSNSYDQKDYSVIPDGFHSYTVYTATKMLDHLAEKYSEFYTVLSASYGNMNSNLAPFADLNSILNATSVFYHEVHCDSTIDYTATTDDTLVRPTIPFGIEVSEKTVTEGAASKNVIVVDLVENDADEFHRDFRPFSMASESSLYHDNEHNIYISSASDYMMLSDGIADSTENGKTKVGDAVINHILESAGDSAKDKLDGAIADAIPFGSTVRDIYSKGKEYYDLVHDTNEENEKIDKSVMQLREVGYINDLAMGGNYSTCGKEDTLVTSLTPNYNLVTVRVAYYNKETGDNLTTDKLLDAFNSEMSGDKVNGEDMRSFHTARVNGKNACFNGENVSESEFERDVKNHIEDKYGLSLENATSTQVQHAIDEVSASYGKASGTR